MDKILPNVLKNRDFQIQEDKINKTKQKYTSTSWAKQITPKTKKIWKATRDKHHIS